MNTAALVLLTAGLLVTTYWALLERAKRLLAQKARSRDAKLFASLAESQEMLVPTLGPHAGNGHSKLRSNGDPITDTWLASLRPYPAEDSGATG